MPIPKSRNPSKTIRFLSHENPSLPHRQRVAIALNVARKAGAKIAKRKYRKSSDGAVKNY